MKYNDNSIKIAEWTTKKLKDFVQGLFNSIYVFECYGSKDLIWLELAYRELEKRGYKISEKRGLSISR